MVKMFTYEELRKIINKQPTQLKQPTFEEMFKVNERCKVYKRKRKRKIRVRRKELFEFRVGVYGTSVIVDVEDITNGVGTTLVNEQIENIPHMTKLPIPLRELIMMEIEQLEKQGKLKRWWR